MKVMKITTVLSIQQEDAQVLISIIQRFNSACNWLSTIAFQERMFYWLHLQRRAYHELRLRYGISAAEAVVIIRKVAYAYRNKASRFTLASFKLLGAIPVYHHTYKRDGTVLVYGQRLKHQARPDVMLSSKCQATLVYQKGRFFLHQIIEVTAPAPYQAKNFLGCDLGIVNILADSDGAVYSGGQLNGLRKRHARLKASLQTKNTRSAKRLLRRRRHKEHRFARDVNHCISKKVVAKAKDTLRGIALEDLSGIRERITVRKAQRRQHYSWGFAQLRHFIEYKADLAGVPVALVNPRNTSRTCPSCGLIDKANRVYQSHFCCVACGFAGPADIIAAVNIGRRALGNAPEAAVPTSCESHDALLGVNGIIAIRTVESKKGGEKINVSW